MVSGLELPKSMGLIVRTAGLSRTKTEIKRDFDYLARLWDDIRENTLSSPAPALIHSDSDLIKRAIRDIYNREIEEVIVEGEEGYKSAKAFMKMLMPSHARRVKAYSDPVPLFQRYGAEDQLKAMYDPVVQLKSGGYLVINPTEALVSIDINSGRSTKEHGIEQTALHTNLEAAKEIARQLRLRDMAGLVVIDFIDQEHHSNTRKVERAMKDALKTDRARIQVGRISSFGLMEMSRQRLRTGVLEATTRECPHCDGTGLVRTASSAGLSALRLIEDEAAKGKGTRIRLSASTEAAVYLLNEKRTDLLEIEERYGVTVEVLPEGEDEGAKMDVTSLGPKPKDAPRFEPIVDDGSDDDDFDDDEDEDDTDEREDREERDDDGDDRPRKKRRRRRGGRGRSKSRGNGEDGDNGDNGEDSSDDRETGDNGSDDDEDEDGRPKKRRKRGGRRRGGRGRGNRSDDGNTEIGADDAKKLEEVSEHVADDMAVVAGPEDSAETAEAVADEDKPKKRAPRRKKATEADGAVAEAGEDKPKPKRSRKKKADVEEAQADGETADAAPAEEKPKRTRRKKADTPAAADDAGATAEDAPKPARRSRAKKAKPAETETEQVAEQVQEDMAVVAGPDDAPQTAEKAAEDDANKGEAGKPRRGWWQRTFGE